MIRVDAGAFTMGSDHDYPEERPAHLETLRAFSIATSPVTVAEFGAFVEATGWVTVAERPPAGFDVPAGSAVFVPTSGPVDLADPLQWWAFVEGAWWREPTGPGSAAPADHPVVQVGHADALAYCDWAGVRLPTEPEWERAAAGATVGNVWQGAFPWEQQGLGTTAPVAPRDFLGNVWEWTSTPWTHDHQPRCCAPTSTGESWVAKGGSYLCAPEYCARYRPAARMAMGADAPTCHLGFRVCAR